MSQNAARAARALAGLAALLLAPAACGPGEPPPRDPDAPPSLLLVTLDTTRADHVGCYGYPRPTTPKLDALCAESVVHERAYATSSWTLPSHASLFTGKYTASHGARYDPDGPLLLDAALPVEVAEHYRARGLAEGERTLAALLGEAGFATAGVVAGPWMKRIFGLDRGFEHYDDSGIDALEGRPAASVTDAALAWLEEAPEPWFLFLNYYDPHVPYEAPERFRRPVARAAAPEGALAGAARRAVTDYDAEIRYMDHHLGRLLDALRERGRFESTWIVVTADHGELFGEHGEYGHGVALWEGELRVPLVVRPPGGTAPERRAQPLSIVELMPRLLTALGREVPEAVLRTREAVAPGRAFAELYPHRGGGRWTALVDGPLKALATPGGRTLLYDVTRDPRESRNLAPDARERVARMAAAMERLPAALPAPPQGSGEGELRRVDAETRRALRELGYLE